MWQQWCVLVCVLCVQASPLPKPDDDALDRQPRHLELDCCPCPPDRTSPRGDLGHLGDLGDLDLASAATGDCPCLQRAADSEAAASGILPLPRLRPMLRLTDPTDDPKPLLHPEVGLASSVLETLREATDEELQEAQARDAARAADPDTLSEASRNIVTIILNPAETTDDALTSATHNHESRFIHGPLGKRADVMVPSSNNFELFSRSTSNAMDMDSGASDIRETVLESPYSGGLTLRLPSVKLLPEDVLFIGKKRLNDFEIISTHGFNDVVSQNVPRVQNGRYTSPEYMRNDGNMDSGVSPSNIQETVGQRRDDMSENPDHKNKPNIKPKVSNNLMNLFPKLNLQDAELVPAKILHNSEGKDASAQIPSLKLPTLDELFARRDTPPVTIKLPTLLDIFQNNGKPSFEKNTEDAMNVTDDSKTPAPFVDSSEDVDKIGTEVIDALPSSTKNIEVFADDNKDDVMPENKQASEKSFFSNTETIPANVDVDEEVQNEASTSSDIEQNAGEFDSTNDGMSLITSDEDTPNDQTEAATDVDQPDSNEDSIGNDEDNSAQDTTNIEQITPDRQDASSSQVENDEREVVEAPGVESAHDNNIVKPSLNGLDLKEKSNILQKLDELKNQHFQILDSLKQSKVNKQFNSNSITKTIPTADNSNRESQSSDHEQVNNKELGKKTDNSEETTVQQADTGTKEKKIVEETLKESSQEQASSGEHFMDEEVSGTDNIEEKFNINKASNKESALLKDDTDSNAVERILTNEQSDKGVINNIDSKADNTCPSVLAAEKTDTRDDSEKSLVANADMKVDASAPIVSKSLSPSKLHLESPLRQSLIVQPNPLNTRSNLFEGSPLDLGNLVRTHSLPNIDDLRTRISGLFGNTGLNFRNSDSRKYFSERDNTENEPQVGASAPQIHTSLPTLRPLKEIDIDIFKFNPLKLTRGEPIKGLDLNELKARVLVPNIDLKPMKLRSTFGNKKDGLLGATLTLQPGTKNTLWNTDFGSPSLDTLRESLNLPDLSNMGSSIKSRTQDLLQSSKLNLNSGLIPTSGLLSSIDHRRHLDDIRENAAKAMNNLQQSLSSSLDEAKLRSGNVLGSSRFAQPEDIHDVLSKARFDIDDRLKTLQENMAERLSTVHEQLRDSQAFLGYALPQRSIDSSRFRTSKLKSHGNKKLTPRKKQAKSGTSVASQNNSPNFKLSNANNSAKSSTNLGSMTNNKDSNFRMNAFESSPVPVSVIRDKQEPLHKPITIKKPSITNTVASSQTLKNSGKLTVIPFKPTPAIRRPVLKRPSVLRRPIDFQNRPEEENIEKESVMAQTPQFNEQPDLLTLDKPSTKLTRPINLPEEKGPAADTSNIKTPISKRPSRPFAGLERLQLPLFNTPLTKSASTSKPISDLHWLLPKTSILDKVSNPEGRSNNMQRIVDIPTIPSFNELLGSRLGETTPRMNSLLKSTKDSAGSPSETFLRTSLPDPDRFSFADDRGSKAKTLFPSTQFPGIPLPKSTYKINISKMELPERTGHFKPRVILDEDVLAAAEPINDVVKESTTTLRPALASSLLNRLGDSVRGRSNGPVLTPSEIKLLGSVIPKSDMLVGSSNKLDVVGEAPLKENVSYKCRMVCTRE